MLKNQHACSVEELIRATQQIKPGCTEKFDAAPCKIWLGGETMACIRLQVAELAQIPYLLAQYKKQGIAFETTRRIDPSVALIVVTKFFDLDRLADNIYFDNDLTDVYYLIIPGGLTWTEFERITRVVKNNSPHKVFDAALASVLTKQGYIDLVRVYDRHSNIEVLTTLLGKFVKEINRGK